MTLNEQDNTIIGENSPENIEKNRDRVTRENEKDAMRVSRISIYTNVVLTALKLAAGIIAHSGAMISDAVHSASDVFSTFIVMAGVRISARASDKEHPYGHERFECIASIILAALLFAVGIGIGKSGIEKLSSGNANLAAPGALALVAAIVSIVVKEWMYRFTMKTAKRISSPALKADAWHHRSDALSSIGSLVGIGAAMLGFPIFDPIASLVICVFILKASIDIFRDAMDRTVDRACDARTEDDIRREVMDVRGVRTIDRLNTRMFGSRIYVELEIGVNGEQSMREGHNISEEVHDRIEKKFPGVKHCMIHINPVD